MPCLLPTWKKWFLSTTMLWNFLRVIFDPIVSELSWLFVKTFLSWAHPFHCVVIWEVAQLCVTDVALPLPEANCGITSLTWKNESISIFVANYRNCSWGWSIKPRPLPIYIDLNQIVGMVDQTTSLSFLTRYHQSILIASGGTLIILFTCYFECLFMRWLDCLWKYIAG